MRLKALSEAAKGCGFILVLNPEAYTLKADPEGPFTHNLLALRAIAAARLNPELCTVKDLQDLKAALLHVTVLAQKQLGIFGPEAFFSLLEHLQDYLADLPSSVRDLEGNSISGLYFSDITDPQLDISEP